MKQNSLNILYALPSIYTNVFFHKIFFLFAQKFVQTM